MRFTVRNRHNVVMQFFLEPEGQDFDIPPGKEVIVELSGDDPAACLDCAESAEGTPFVSLWSDHGSYKVLVDGRDAWELVLLKGPRRVFE